MPKPIKQSPPQTSSPEQTRIALGIEYDGSAFHGWQFQLHDAATVQQEVETALSKIAATPVRVTCAGRTDAGVHATAQVVHFDTTSVRNERAWVLGTNTKLPPQIRILWAKTVSSEFHARFSATGRRYTYVIANREVKPAIMGRQFSWQCLPLDVEKMAAAAQYLVGEHDFTSYRSVHCQANNPVRTVHELNVERRDELVILTIHANAFLYHMVRNVAGVLMAVGCGKAQPEWARQVLEAHDRTQGGVTAPPFGLYLVGIDYPDHFAIPESKSSLSFLN